MNTVDIMLIVNLHADTGPEIVLPSEIVHITQNLLLVTDLR